MHVKNCKSFAECRKWARKQGFWLERQHAELAKKGLIPEGIPNYPDTYFKRRKEWTNWPDYLNAKKYNPEPTFEEAKKIIEKYNLQTQVEFLQWQKKYGKKYFIVNNPAKQFKGKYKGMMDFLGVKPKYVSFSKAKKIAKTFKFTCRREYWGYIRKNPQHNIPTSPDSYYKKQWTNWGDYLGNGYIPTTQRKDGYYVSFDEFKKFVKKFNFKGQREWESWNRTHTRPKKIPMAISKVYEKEWKGWADALGYTPKQRFYKEHWDYKTASAWAKSKKIKSGAEYLRKARGIKGWLPPQMVKDIEDYFRRKNEWKSWSHFLGLPPNRKANRHFRTYEQTKAWAKRKKITTYDQWVKIKKPFDIPYTPAKTYKGKGWRSWMEFLDKEPIMDFEQARDYARSLNVKTTVELLNLKKQGKLKSTFPFSFWNKYHKDPRWVSMSDFIGSDIKNSHHRVWRKYDEAVKYLKDFNFSSQSKYTKWAKTEERPADIPSSPERVYKKIGDWKGWSHYLGNKPKYRIITFYKKPKEYWTYAKAKKFVNKLGLKNQADWYKYVRSGKKPIHIPSSPQSVYRKKRSPISL